MFILDCPMTCAFKLGKLLDCLMACIRIDSVVSEQNILREASEGSYNNLELVQRKVFAESDPLLLYICTNR